MTQRKNEDAKVELVCIETCGDQSTWMVEGRFNAEGEFEPHDGDDVLCPECGGDAEPTDPDTRLADVD